MNGIVVNVSTELVTEVCPRLGCGILHAVPKDFQERRRKDHAEFYCPNGHTAHYYGETDEQKKIRALEEDKRILESRVRQAEEGEEIERQAREQSQRSHAATKGVLTRTKKKIAKGQCPCCSMLFVDLLSHIRRRHPAYPTTEGES